MIKRKNAGKMKKKHIIKSRFSGHRHENVYACALFYIRGVHLGNCI